MNRFFPNVHAFVAKAEAAQGDLDAAIRTMSRAVLYETPWDEANKAVQRAALAALQAEAAAAACAEGAVDAM